MNAWEGSLWKRINEYAEACGGDTSSKTVSIAALVLGSSYTITSHDHLYRVRFHLPPVYVKRMVEVKHEEAWQ